MPKDTYGWGGVVRVGGESNQCFYFADFRGDCVVIQPSVKLEAHEVAWYDNSIELPPKN